ncbi:polysaccharide deacetylase family protein [Priestia megaterium]
MTLKDLFNEDANYLDRLSAISYAELKKQMKKADFDPDLQKGTQAADQNFSQFALLENSIVIYFKPYQLGAEQTKTKTIAIQKDLFKDMLSDAYKDEAANKNKVKETPPKHIVNEMPKQGAPIDPTKKVVAMTFDDGPSPSSTNVILDGLKEVNGHATFFVLGSRVQYYPETIERMVKEGNEVGNHSWDHPQLTRLNEAQVKHQIGDTQALIKQVSGYEPLHVRPPYGAVNANVRRYIGNVGVTLWDIDPEDWKYRNVPHSVQAVMSQAGDGKVILMHDIYQTSAEAAVEIMKKLHAQGYQLVTISQLEQVKKEREQLRAQ